jgi:hypothetical protein
MIFTSANTNANANAAANKLCTTTETSVSLVLTRSGTNAASCTCTLSNLNCTFHYTTPHHTTLLHTTLHHTTPSHTILSDCTALALHRTGPAHPAARDGRPHAPARVSTLLLGFGGIARAKSANKLRIIREQARQDRSSKVCTATWNSEVQQCGLQG